MAEGRGRKNYMSWGNGRGMGDNMGRSDIQTTCKKIRESHKKSPISIANLLAFFKCLNTSWVGSSILLAYLASVILMLRIQFTNDE